MLKEEIEKELAALKTEYGDERRTRIEGAIDILTEADLIPDEEVVVTLTRQGYIKRVPLETYMVYSIVVVRARWAWHALEESDDVMQDVFVAKTS